MVWLLRMFTSRHVTDTAVKIQEIRLQIHVIYFSLMSYIGIYKIRTSNSKDSSNEVMVYSLLLYLMN